MDLKRWWYEPPAGATLRTIKTTTGILYVCAAVLCALGAATTRGFTGQVYVYGLCVVAALLGVVLIRLDVVLPRWCYHLVAFYGTGALLAYMWLAKLDHGSAAFSAPVALISVNVPFIFALREVVIDMVIIVAGTSVTLALFGAPTGSIVMVQGSVVLVAVVATWLARLGDAAEHDYVTGVLNRRGFDRRLEGCLDTLPRNRGRLALAILDIDHFKRINDEHGHLYGDEVLRACATAWTAALPAGGVLGRLSGDEFAVLLHGLERDEAVATVQRIVDATPRAVSTSAGVVVHHVDDQCDEDEEIASHLKRRADSALYVAKRRGRARVELFGEAQDSLSDS